MMKTILALAIMLIAAMCTSAQWGKPKADVIPEADGYVAIPGAAVTPEKTRIYKAVWDATRAAKSPTDLLPVLNMAGSELNAFAASGVPLGNVKFVIAFHGPAVDGILNDESYRAKFGVANPNLKVLAEMKKAGVKLYVCGQHLIGEKIDPKTLSPDVTIAADALIVLMAFQSDGYALLTF